MFSALPQEADYAANSARPNSRGGQWGLARLCERHRLRERRLDWIRRRQKFEKGNFVWDRGFQRKNCESVEVAGAALVYCSGCAPDRVLGRGGVPRNEPQGDCA